MTDREESVTLGTAEERTSEELYNRFMLCRRVGRTVKHELAKSALFYLRYGHVMEFWALIGVIQRGDIEEATEAAQFEAALEIADELGVLCPEVAEATYAVIEKFRDDGDEE